MFQFANCKRLPEAGEPLGKLPSVYLENGFWCDSDSESIDFFPLQKTRGICWTNGAPVKVVIPLPLLSQTPKKTTHTELRHEVKAWIQ